MATDELAQHGVRTEAATAAPARREPADSQVGRVVTHLRDHIAAKGLKPGDRLPSEAAIGQELGVSRPVVREAMRALAATGLIEMAVGRRATVSGLGGDILRNVFENAVLVGQADAWHVMEMRRGVEIAMVRLAAQRCTAADARRLTALCAEMAERIRDADAYADLDLRFHMLLAKTTRNALYVMLVEACRQMFETTMVLGIARWAATPELDRVQQLHESIVAAVTACDPDAAEAAMAQHFDSAIRVMFGARPGPGV